jgi:hypothetical protein
LAHVATGLKEPMSPAQSSSPINGSTPFGPIDDYFIDLAKRSHRIKLERR